MSTPLDAGTFLEKFEAQFEELEPGTISLETEFRQLAEWTSMQSLVVIASFDWEFGVMVTADELKQAVTVGDLFETVKVKAG